jgi:hypothetical protein
VGLPLHPFDGRLCQLENCYQKLHVAIPPASGKIASYYFRNYIPMMFAVPQI